MIGILVTLGAACGTYFLYTAVAMGWCGFPGWRSLAERSRAVGNGRVRDWMVQAGIAEQRPAELAGLAAVVAVAGGFLGVAIFGAAWPAAVMAVAVGVGWPLASCRARRERTRAAAQEAWPALIDEIRILTANLGRSVPQALFEAGARAPAELRPAFEAAQREWLLSFDLERTVAVLKSRLADPTADAACETLLVAHQVGGADLDRRLEALAADRQLDVQGRKDARARQAGVRFSRRFVLLVPAGMALVGAAIGTGRDAYRTSWGQAMVVVGVGVIVGCWAWAGRLLRLPVDERVWR
ncbi:MAG: type II secretion system F family protein [Acidimicrobiales bacterium]